MAVVDFQQAGAASRRVGVVAVAAEGSEEEALVVDLEEGGDPSIEITNSSGFSSMRKCIAIEQIAWMMHHPPSCDNLFTIAYFILYLRSGQAVQPQNCISLAC